MQRILSVLVIVLLSATVVLAGCSSSTGTPATGSAPGMTSASTAANSNFVTSPTDVIPENNVVKVTVQEKVYDGTIPVVFNGGKGQSLVKSIDVTLYTSDGQVVTKKIETYKGATITLQGTKDPNNPDRVVVYVSEMNGETYKVADVLSTYRQH